MSDIAGGDWALEGWAVRASTMLARFGRGSSIIRSIGERPLTILAPMLLCLGAMAAMGFASVSPRAPSENAPHAVSMIVSVVDHAAPPRLVWTDIAKPIEIFNLEISDLAKAPRTYGAGRNSSGGRRDVIALGALASDEPAIRLALYRQGHETVAATPAFADLARLAAEAGLSITRSGLPDLLPTRFGSFEVVALGLTRGPTASSCSGFKLALDAPAFGIMGLACGGKTMMTRARLACLLDRIDLVAGGGDKPLVDFFAASELRRDNACEGMRLGPDAIHAARFDGPPATPHRNRRRH